MIGSTLNITLVYFVELLVVLVTLPLLPRLDKVEILLSHSLPAEGVRGQQLPPGLFRALLPRREQVSAVPGLLAELLRVVLGDFGTVEKNIITLICPKQSQLFLMRPQRRSLIFGLYFYQKSDVRFEPSTGG